MVPTDSPSPLAPLPHRCDRPNHHHPHSHTISQPQLLQHRNNVPTTQSLRSVLATGCEFPIDHHHQCAPSSSSRYPTAGSSSAARPAPHFETSNCGRPQMAHEMYKRLLAVAERRHPKPMSFTPLEVRLAAFTGHRLAFREATGGSGGVATSLAVDFHTL